MESEGLLLDALVERLQGLLREIDTIINAASQAYEITQLHLIVNLRVMEIGLQHHQQVAECVGRIG